MTTRRQFVTSLIAAPAVITTPGLLMTVRQWKEPVWPYKIMIFHLHSDSMLVPPSVRRRIPSELFLVTSPVGQTFVSSHQEARMVAWSMHRQLERLNA